MDSAVDGTDTDAGRGLELDNHQIERGKQQPDMTWGVGGGACVPGWQRSVEEEEGFPSEEWGFT